VGASPQKQIDEKRRRLSVMSDEIGQQGIHNISVDLNGTHHVRHLWHSTP
jgi:hypothetical protein